MGTAAWFVVFASGCLDEAPVPVQPGGPFTSVAGVQETLRLTRQAAAPPATVLVALELSEAALGGFLGLELAVDVYSAESVPGQGLRAQWLGEPTGEPVMGDFGGDLAAVWSAQLPLSTRPCSSAPCLVRLQIAPQGEWASELSFPIEYDVVARLDYQRADAAHVPSEQLLQLSVEVQP